MKKLIAFTASILMVATLFTNSFAVSTVEVYAQDGYECDEDAFVTSKNDDSMLKIYTSDNTEYSINKIYTCCNFNSIYGDVDYSGRVTARDLLLLKKLVLGEEEQMLYDEYILSRYYVQDYLGVDISDTPTILIDSSAFDVNRDGSVNSVDFVAEMQSIINNDSDFKCKNYSAEMIDATGDSMDELVFSDAMLSDSSVKQEKKAKSSIYINPSSEDSEAGMHEYIHTAFDHVNTYKILDYHNSRYLICLLDSVYLDTFNDGSTDYEYSRAAYVYEILDDESLREACKYTFVKAEGLNEIVFSTGTEEVDGLVAKIQNYFNKNYHFEINEDESEFSYVKNE